jgi:hypothetical protein
MCRHRPARPGAIGKRGSIAVIERFWRTLKDILRVATWVSLRHRSFQHEVRLATGWYNSHRPHMTLEAATPDEVYFTRRRACRQPRFEPRLGWPRAALRLASGACQRATRCSAGTVDRFLWQPTLPSCREARARSLMVPPERLRAVLRVR